MDYHSDLKIIRKKMQSERTNIRKELARAPQGRLLLTKDGKYDDAIWFLKQPDGPIVRKHIKRDPELMSKLARKAFLQEKEARMGQSLGLLDELISPSLSLDDRSIIASLPNRLPELSADWFDGNNKSTRSKSLCPHPVADSSVDIMSPRLMITEISRQEYFRMPYRQNTKNAANKTIMLRNGLSVRSKSEGGIAEIAGILGAVYHYDELLDFGGIWISPDFIYMRSDGKLRIRFLQTTKTWLPEKAGRGPNKKSMPFPLCSTENIDASMEAGKLHGRLIALARDK